MKYDHTNEDNLIKWYDQIIKDNLMKCCHKIEDEVVVLCQPLTS